MEYNVRLTTLDVWLRLRFLLIIAVHTVVGNHLANTVLRSDPMLAGSVPSSPSSSRAFCVLFCVTFCSFSFVSVFSCAGCF